MLRAQRVREQPLQRYPVHTEKRRAERIPVPLAIPGGRDRTPVAAVAMNEPRGLGRNLRQTLAQAQTPQHAGGVGREGDGRADLTQFGRLLSLGRLIMFDKRDTGLSDRAAGEDTPEQRIDDVLAVMRACGSDRAALFGYSEGGPMSILFAATYPERVTALILGAAAARWPAAPDYPCGQHTEEMASALEDLAAHRWGQGDSIEWYAPSLAGSGAARRALARWERMAASPSAVLRMIRMIRTIDVRSILPGINVPVLIIQRSNDRINPPCHGHYLAEHLPRARHFEQPGDHLLWLGDTDAMFTQIEEFLAAVTGT